MFFFARQLFFLELTLLVACQGDSYASLREEGRGKIRALIVELEHIRTQDQLVVRKERLKEAFDQLAFVLEQVDHYALGHPQEPVPLVEVRDQEQSERLRLELLRLTRIEGGEEVLESIRKERSREWNIRLH